MGRNYATVDEYLAAQPEALQTILEEIRARVHEAIPGAGEKISYGMPTITLDGHYVLYFAGWKHHVSVYPVPRGDEVLAAEMAPYLSGAGTLKFPLSKPVPVGLIVRVATQLAIERRAEK